MCRLLQPHLRICQIEAQVPSGAVLFGSIGACHPFRYYLAPVPLQRPVRLSVGRSTAGVFRVPPIQAHSLRQPRSDGGTQNALATAFPIPAGHPLSRVGNACARALNMSQSAGMLTVPIISGFCGRGGMLCDGKLSCVPLQVIERHAKLSCGVGFYPVRELAELRRVQIGAAHALH